jgi:hypothetical protein
MSDLIPPLAADSFRIARTCVTCASVGMAQGAMICERMDRTVLEWHVCDLYENVLCDVCLGASLVTDEGGELIACPACNDAGSTA